jgi:hypothetical protein
MGMQQLEAPRRAGRPREVGRPALPALAIVLAMLTLAGCSPHYRTFTSYTPPSTDGGRQCVAQCLNTQHTCRGDGSRQVEQCRLGAQQEALTENVLRQAGYRMDRKHQSHQTDEAPAPPSPVAPNYWRCDQQAGDLAEQCTADLDLCYQNCGGGVAYTTHCVANCD